MTQLQRHHPLLVRKARDGRLKLKNKQNKLGFYGVMARLFWRILERYNWVFQT